MFVDAADRRLLSAELLSIGTEITVGETRDTNAGELAASLTAAGVVVGRVTAIPDRLDVVAEAFAAGLRRADIVASTGGLGPTPDDLTREAIARVCGETPVVDPGQEAWLRDMWARRAMPFPESNRKQAWLIPSAIPLPNPNGTAPGWFVTRPDGGVIVALPGPPREMRPMWHDHAYLRLQARGLGTDVASRTFRLTGIGESQVAELLGEDLLRGVNPEVATYARVEAVDVRVSAVGDAGGTAADIVEATTAMVTDRLRPHIWATGTTTWSGAIGARLGELGWRLATAEIGTRGQVAGLFGDVDWLVRDEITADTPSGGQVDEVGEVGADTSRGLLALAGRMREAAGAEVGLAVWARERGVDTSVLVAVVTPRHQTFETRMAFLGGSLGRSRAALTAASVLLTALKAED
ncbi:MAG: molybdopterin-binding protein [Candidatus Limnocylindrales bacterium]